MIFEVSIPDKLNVSKEQLKMILDENIVGAWITPIKVILKRRIYEMNDYDYHTLKRILLTNPHYICVGLVSKALMESLIILQLSGIIKHILFYDCDPIECYIVIEWSKTK